MLTVDLKMIGSAVHYLLSSETMKVSVEFPVEEQSSSCFVPMKVSGKCGHKNIKSIKTLALWLKMQCNI